MRLVLNSASVAASPELLDEFLVLAEQDIAFLKGTYPGFEEWLRIKVLPGVFEGDRTIVAERRSGHLAGLLILKHSSQESKLCTLRVRPEFEFRGMGVRLFELAFGILETTRPLLSVSENSLPHFSRIFDHFGFGCEGIYKSLYLPNVSEMSFNGVLEGVGWSRNGEGIIADTSQSAVFSTPMGSALPPRTRVMHGTTQRANYLSAIHGQIGVLAADPSETPTSARGEAPQKASSVCAASRWLD